MGDQAPSAEPACHASRVPEYRIPYAVYRIPNTEYRIRVYSSDVHAGPCTPHGGENTPMRKHKGSRLRARPIIRHDRYGPYHAWLMINYTPDRVLCLRQAYLETLAPLRSGTFF